MARRARYNDDPSIEDVPLSVEEAQWVAENASKVTRKSHAEHFAKRAAATARQVARMRLDFDNELRRRTAGGSTRGTPSTLSPEEAARFLSEEQLARLFDRFSQEKLAALESMRASTEEKQERLDRQLQALEELKQRLQGGYALDEDTARLLAAIGRETNPQGAQP